MSNDATWKAGDRCVCIRHSFLQVAGVPYAGELPQYGIIYLVMGVFTHNDGTYLELADFRNAAGKYMGFNSNAFRKVVPACDRIAQHNSRSQPQP